MPLEPDPSPTSAPLSKKEQATFNIRHLIRSGQFSNDGYLPTVRKASELVGFNRDAVWRAYTELEKEGYIQSNHNRRFKVHPTVAAYHLRTLNARLITVGKHSIRFSGLQRFHKALVDKQDHFGIRTHLACVMNANEIRPEWLEDMDCVILGGYFEDSHILDALTQDILSFGIIPSENWVPNLTIDSDNQQMGALAAKRLIELGTRSPCLIAYSNLDQRHVLRKLGFQVKWVESGGSLSDIQEHWIDPENTYKKVVELERIVRSLEDRDSLFCLEKESAIDVLNIFEHLNVKVPDRVKVISSDGTFESLTTHPKLTYVKQHFEEMALIAAENIRLLCLDYQDIQSEVPRGQKILVPPELVIHDSA